MSAAVDLGFRVVTEWIFQANPKKYDLLAAAVSGADQRWSMKVHRQDVAVGDRVWFLVAGVQAGLYLVGTVTSPVYEIALDDGFGKWKVDVSYDAFVEPPLLRPELLAVPELKAFHPLRGIMGTNFRVPEPIAAILNSLAKGRLKPIAGATGTASPAHTAFRPASC